jgi:hypothetical protein
MTDFFFGMVVWGESYIDDFLRYSLPTLLGKGNIDSATVTDDTPFVIVTRLQDRLRLRADPGFKALEALVSMDFWELNDDPNLSKYQRVSRAQHEILCAAGGARYIVLVYPDCLWSAGALRNVFSRLAAGAKAVFAPGPTVSPASAHGLLKRFEAVDSTGARSCTVPASEIVATCLEHHHPMWDGFDWDKGRFTDSPACLKWTVSDNAWLIRCLHLHPVALRVQADNPLYFAEIEVSLDGEYGPRLFDDLDDIYFPTDSDELALLSLREPDTPPLPVDGVEARVSSVARWAERHAAVLNKMMLEVAFCWHAGPVDRDGWTRTKERSDRIVRQIQFRLSIPDRILRREDPIAYANRQDRVYDARRWRNPKMGRPRGATAPTVRDTAAGMAAGTTWRILLFLKQSWLGRRLRRDPRLVVLWLRLKARLDPRSRLDLRRG